MFTLPAARIPEWFEHHNRGPVVSFWFRNKFPALAICLAIELIVKFPSQVVFRPLMIVNGNESFLDFGESQCFSVNVDHIFLFDLQKIKFKDNVDERILEKEWHHAQVSYRVASDSLFRPPDYKPLIEHCAKESGIHIFKQKGNMEDIRFTNPYKRAKSDDGLNSPKS